MDKKQKVALILTGVGTLGYIGYRYYLSKGAKKSAEEFAKKWMDKVCKRNSDHIADMYHADGVLLGSSAESISTGRAEIEFYFRQFVEQMPCGTIDDVSVIMRGNTAIVNGNYTFTFVEKDGDMTDNPSRFTFILERDGEDWKILTHHSSPHPTKEVEDAGMYGQDDEGDDDYDDEQ
tara:strand:- start:4455 stop:4985 length:531 start_codon:yes stop_codon:yes gene_type:complete